MISGLGFLVPQLGRLMKDTDQTVAADNLEDHRI